MEGHRLRREKATAKTVCGQTAFRSDRNASVAAVADGVSSSKSVKPVTSIGSAVPDIEAIAAGAVAASSNACVLLRGWSDGTRKASCALV